MSHNALTLATSLFLQLGACTMSLCAGLERRGHAPLRALLAVAVFYAGELLQEPLRRMAMGSSMPLLMLTFAITLTTTCVAVLLVWRISPWQALFCCTAGYIAQNLISGTSDLIDTLVCAAGRPELPWSSTLLMGCLLVYPLYLWLFVRLVRRHNLADISEPQIILVALAVVATVIGLDVVVKSLGASTLGLEAYLMARLAHGVLCGFTLFSEQKILAARQLATEREVERRMAAERERQYQLSRKNIDAINVKCHDIKHQIRSLADGERVADGRALEDLAAEIAIYDSTVKTENPALDVILTEKGLVCSGEKITLAVIADGRALECLEPQENLLALWKRAGQRHRGGARHRGARAAAHLAQRAALRHHVRHQRGEQLRRGARLQGRRARHDQGRRRQPRLWHQEHARHRRAPRRRPHLRLRGRRLPRGRPATGGVRREGHAACPPRGPSRLKGS